MIYFITFVCWTIAVALFSSLVYAYKIGLPDNDRIGIKLFSFVFIIAFSGLLIGFLILPIILENSFLERSFHTFPDVGSEGLYISFILILIFLSGVFSPFLYRKLMNKNWKKRIANDS
jgi:uncharacterized BrkB/YihY/UPF0761 family membrane protein